MVGKRLIAMQCGERGLGHLSLVFGLLAVGTLSLSVATDFWLFTTEALDPSMLEGDTPIPSPPSPELPAPPSDVGYYYDDLNATDEMEDFGGELDMDYLPPDDTGLFPIVIANMHSGLWRSCIYFDDQGISYDSNLYSP